MLSTVNANHQSPMEESAVSAIRIAQAQINTIVGDFRANTARMIRAIEEARRQDADILTLPELATCGYPPEDLLLRPSFLKDNLAALEQVKKHVRDIIVLVGYVDFDGDKVFNSAGVIQDQELLATYHKVELPNYGVFDEKRYFESGQRRLLLAVNDLLFTVSLCEDLWVAGNLPETVARDNQVDFVLNISASPFHAGKLEARRDTAARFARNTAAVLCFNNLVGAQDELVFDGGSFIMSPDGKTIDRAPSFAETMLVTDLHFDPKGRKPIPAGDQRTQLVNLKNFPDRHKDPLPAAIADECTPLDATYRALVLGTKDYVTKNDFQKVIIGLSGGIDSALTSVIAVDALGSDNVIGVTMPSRYTSPETLTDAGRLAENLGVRLINIPLQEIYQAYLAVLKEPFGPVEPGVAHENIQARIRGNLLMALSNQFGWLVLTTGNKSEISVGYCTLYGDMAGGFGVIKDVPKTMVYELCEHVNKIRGEETIPRTILERPPSAELRPDQKDQDTLPPYSLLDRVLHAYVEEDRAPLEIIAAGFDKQLVLDIVRRVDKNEYKRRQAPAGIKITPKAFGKDRRVPITNRYWKKNTSSTQFNSSGF